MIHEQMASFSSNSFDSTLRIEPWFCNKNQVFVTQLQLLHCSDILKVVCWWSVPKSCLTLCDPMDWLQHARLACPSLYPGVCLDSYPLSQWCYPTISSSAIHYSFCFQPFPTSETFPVSQLFTSGGQSSEASASASVLPMSIQGWFPLQLTGLISLQSNGLSRVFSSTTVQRHPFCSAQPSLRSKSRIWGLPWWLSW